MDTAESVLKLVCVIPLIFYAIPALVELAPNIALTIKNEWRWRRKAARRREWIRKRDFAALDRERDKKLSKRALRTARLNELLSE